MKRTREQRGITLMALIITIVILLILAVVTIKEVQGDGIIAKAWEAKNKYSEAKAKEKVALQLEEWKIVKNTQKEANLGNYLTEKFGEENIVANEDGTYTVKTEGYGVIVDTNGDVIGVTNSNNNNNDNNDNIENGGDTNNPNDENQEGTNNPGEDITQGTLPGESNTEPTEQIAIDTIAQVNSTITGEPYRRTNPIIPAGFKAINTETSSWDAEDGPEVNNGLVITDGTNEFVWVPVTSTIEAYNVGTEGYREPDVVTQECYWDENTERFEYRSGSDNDLTYLGIVNNILGTTYENSEDFKIALTEEFNNMATSANTYGGFYVGRYEMSLSSDKTAQSKYGEVSSDASQEDTNTWYGLYARAKTYATTSVQSSMIWGSQCDAMVTWMGAPAYTTIGDDRNMREDRKTGLVETDKIKNVYDLYGNYFEWTLEANKTNNRVGIGGAYYSGDYEPSFRSYYGPTNADSTMGSRLTLYIL